MMNGNPNLKPEVFVKAAEYVRRGWTQETFARDGRGEPVKVDAESACEWCVAGALKAACMELELCSAFRWASEIHLRKSIGLPDSVTLTGWNDATDRLRSEVIEALEMA